MASSICPKSWRLNSSMCLVSQSCLALCDAVDCSPPSSSVHEILQARILEWVASIPPGALPNPETEPTVSCFSCIAGEFFTTSATFKPKLIQCCLLIISQ